MLGHSLIHGAEVTRVLVPRATPGTGFKLKPGAAHVGTNSRERTGTPGKLAAPRLGEQRGKD